MKRNANSQGVEKGNVPPTAPMTGEKKKIPTNIKLVFFLALISCLVYGNTLKNGFVFDDFTVITENTFVQKGIKAIPEILSTPYRRGYTATVNDLYRPLSVAMFAIEYQFFGKDAMPFHFVNICLFACCVVLLFLFLDKLFERKKTVVAFIAALLFALHPIHTEVVANIKSCDELLCFLFAFLNLRLFLQYEESGKLSNALSGALCLFLSLLSKETAITLVVAVPLIFIFYRNENKKRSVKIILSTCLLAAVYLAIRFSVLVFYHAAETSNISIVENALASPGISFSSRIATAILVLGYYARLLVIPYPLVSDYSYNSIPFVGFADPEVLAALAFYIFIIVLAARRLAKHPRDPYAFGIFFFLITLSLFSNIPFLIGTMMGERLLFFPSVGFCFITALLIEKVPGKALEWSAPGSKKWLFIVIPVSVAFFILTFNRNSAWRSNYTLFSTDIVNEPESHRINFNLGAALMVMANEENDAGIAREKRDEGIAYTEKGLAIYANDEPAQSALCNAFFRNGQYDSAEVHGEIAYRLNPTIISTLNDLAGISYIKKDYARAITFCKQEIALTPGSVQPYANLGLCYMSLAKYDSAIYFLKSGASIAPGTRIIYKTLSSCYAAEGIADSANKFEAMAR